MKTIQIDEAIAKMHENPSKTYKIKYVRANRKLKGTIKEGFLGVARSASSKKDYKKTTSKRKYLFKDKWTLMLWNYDKGRIETPLFSHIIEFDNKKVIH